MRQTGDRRIFVRLFDIKNHKTSLNINMIATGPRTFIHFLSGGGMEPIPAVSEWRRGNTSIVSGTQTDNRDHSHPRHDNSELANPPTAQIFGQWQEAAVARENAADTGDNMLTPCHKGPTTVSSWSHCAWVACYRHHAVNRLKKKKKKEAHKNWFNGKMD